MRSKRIIGWILITVGILFYAFFKEYTGKIIPYPFVFYLIGLVFIITGFVILRKTPKLNEINTLEKAEALKKDLKENGLKIEVELDICEIKENHYYEEPDSTKNYSDFELLNFSEMAKYYEMFQRSKSDEVKQSVVIAKIQVNGQERKVISPILPYDRIKLLLSFDKQKSTSVFFDKNDHEKYYFDFEFMREKS